MKNNLYCVTLEYKVLIEAGSSKEAESEAEYFIKKDGNEANFIQAREIHSIKDIPQEWRSSIPFGGDKNDDRTCFERVSGSMMTV